MKLTRRKLASVLAPSLAAGAMRTAVAQTQATSPASPQPASGPALDAARARMKQTGDVLAQQAVPMDVEPAFQFKA
ncbi:MAG TPA: hypothetical protein VML19_20765 [Verrucomicrobiae bacterium]|nr:hypothetical protein [Verrucomicrobiae bacterium]